MPKTNKYIGIENELTSFAKNEPATLVAFKEYFSAFANESDCFLSGRSVANIRSITGNDYYIDGDELEIVTPPIAINKGFSSRLTDSLVLGRNRAARATPDIIHTGYSMHWNITPGKVNLASFIEGVYVPFSLFGLTPLSIGLNIKSKDFGKRYQLAGDSIPDENQINATALILGAYSFAIEENENCPLIFKNACNEQYESPLLSRNSTICAAISESNTPVQLSVQEYIEIFYKWIEPAAKLLGTKKEVHNLKGFIYGRKELEMDRMQYYAYLKDNEGKGKCGEYYPIDVPGFGINRQIIRPANKLKKTPLEGILLGGIIKESKHLSGFTIIDWDFLKYSHNNKTTEVRTISEVYKAANRIVPGTPKFKGSSGIKAASGNIDSLLENLTEVAMKNLAKQKPETNQAMA